MWFSHETTTSSMPSTRTILSVAASLTASVVLLRTLVNDLIPDAVQDYFSMRLHKLSSRLSSELTVVIDEFEGYALNQMFAAASVYSGNTLSSSTQRIKVMKWDKEKQLEVNIDKNQELVDSFNGAEFKWTLNCSRNEKLVFVSNGGDNRNAFAEARRYELDHPATFETIAMDSETKKVLIDDLNRFMARKEYYRRVGKAWKRGYLLYGPPGTGKSSLIAAMANYLNFDIYDLDLKEVQCNSDLRRLLIGTGNRSILVIEDIDCSIDLQNRNSEDSYSYSQDEKITLSGLLNLIDGLWSCCGDERIVVFTTNHKDKLDPALLRPGRMDLHLHMSEEGEGNAC